MTILPTGIDAFTNEETLRSVNWIYSLKINDKISTTGGPIISHAIDGRTGSSSLPDLSQVWTVRYALTKQVGMFTECFARIPGSADTMQSQHFFNVGFTYLFSDDTQWEIRYGRGPS